MKKSKLFTKAIALAMCIAMLLTLCACSESKEQKQVFAMDTVMTLTAYGKNAKTGLDAATGVINSLNTLFDPEVENSAANLLNNAEGQNVIVTPQVAEILNTALKVCKQSNGALDLSVYPLYLAWGEFDKDKGRIPSSKEIKSLLQNVNFSETSITEFNGESNYSVRMPAGTQISFGAAAKGCASDRAIEAMRSAGVESGIVSLGGNVQTLGLKPDGSKWTVAVEDPNNTGSYVGTLSVGETAIVTSGNYQRYFIGSDGIKYHHIIDPDTGNPANNGLVSVTVVCEDGTLADCLSTAMFVLGVNGALRYWRNYGGFDMVMITDENEVICTSGLVEVFELTNTKDYTSKFTE